MLLNSLLPTGRCARLLRPALLLTAAILLAGSHPLVAAPADENFDGVAISGGYSFGESPRTINGWTFRLVNGSGSNDNQAYVDVTNQSSDTALANNGTDKALILNGWLGVATAARISASDSAEFSLVSFRIDNGFASSGNYRVLGYRDGSAVDGASQNFSAATYANTLVTLSGTAWGNIDEFRIVRQDGSADVSFYIDDIDVSAAVIPNNAPTDIQLSNASVNQSGGANATVGTLSTTDPDGDDTHTYALVSGTGDTHNASFNLSGSSLRANETAALAAGEYSVRIQTDDGNGGTYSESFSITVVDDVAPLVTSVVVPPDATYRADEALDFTVTFNEAVTVTGVPTLGITIGEEPVLAAYQSGNGTTALTFQYLVHSGDEDTNGVAIGALGLAGASIRDAADNDVITTLNNVGATAGVLVDATAPYVVSITRKNPVEQTTDATTVVFEVVFSEAVTGLKASMFTITAVNDGTVTGTVAEVTGGPTTYDVMINLTGGTGEFRLYLAAQ